MIDDAQNSLIADGTGESRFKFIISMGSSIAFCILSDSFPVGTGRKLNVQVAVVNHFDSFGITFHKNRIPYSF